MILLAAASVILLAGAGLALALRDNVHRGWASLATQAGASVLVLAAVLPTLLRGGDVRYRVAWSYPVESIAVHLDPLGAFFLAWSLPMTLVGTAYAFGYLRPYFRTRNAGVQFALLNMISLSFVMVYTLESAFPFLLGWEIAAVSAWLLVVWDYRNQKIRFAGFNYLVSTHVGLFVLLAAFMVLHSQTGSMDFQSFSAFLQHPSRLRSVTFLLLVTAFGLKSAFFPFHTWLPRAHSAAPAHVSALMSGVIHKAGLFGLLRFTLLLGEPEPWMGWYLVGFSALSAVVGVLYTTSQRDLKRLLGYSSTENVGIAGIGFGIGYLGLAWHQPALVALGFTGGVLHVLNHALFKCLLFYAAGAVYRSTHSVDLERLGGLARRLPWTAGYFLLGALAISALPPFNGFVSELLVYAGLLNPAVPAGIPRVLLVAGAAALAFVGGVSALAMTRAFGVTFLGAPRDAKIHCEGEVSRWMRGAMAVHAAGVVLVGLVPGVGLAVVDRPVRLFRARAGAMALGDLEPVRALAPVAWIAALVVGVLGALLLVRRWLARGAPAPRHVTWGCGYGAPTPRMQYTGTSFASQFAALFYAVLPHHRRAKLPEGPFPEKVGHLNTHCVDAVEKRMFEVMGEGDRFVTRLAARIPADLGVSLGAGLVVLAVMVGLVLAGTGGLP
ncbi:proton-conducting transporter transmembrane domain-containing protein [Anaeromyxobacter oryzae]|uniref:Hydrogenase n=1 Tax=Anaeromyxobacter oryzae TaxID=2918170 RepID=A0ABM7WST9_9BACT|nr:proton-conducting transporter membrane subunit [Anaeromyxobacter oryzae]BDG02564.1 hydrogenase [Anaeromyxobacter oryzae]